MPILESSCCRTLRRAGQCRSYRRWWNGQADKSQRGQRRQFRLIVRVVNLRGQVFSKASEQFGLNATTEGITDVERTRQRQRCQERAFLHVMPLNVVYRRRIAKAVLQSSLHSNFVVIGGVRRNLK